MGHIPPECTAVATLPSPSAIPQPEIAVRISLASCGAEVRFNALHLGSDDASIGALSDAAKPSLDLLDAAIAQNDPTMTPLARSARADLFESMVVRIRSAMPPITMQNAATALAAHAALEVKISSWVDKSH